MRKVRTPARATLAVALGLAGLAAPAALAEAPPTGAEAPEKPESRSLFDPARHMHVADVKVGMKGYGVSVFKGTKLERFDVEVIAVLKNFNPTYDVVLITCKGANLEHTGAIAGMSGSPIYLTDEAGKDRMIGAFAYGWPLAKDPIAGVQPIEYMLNLPTDIQRSGGPSPAAESPQQTGSALNSVKSVAGGRWTLGDARRQWNDLMHPAATATPLAHTSAAGRLTGGDLPVLQPLATPLMSGGLSPAVLETFGPAFRAAGLTPVQAGGLSSGVELDAPAVSGAAKDDVPGVKLEPGAVLAVPLLTGDADMTALGTCTEVLGDRVFGFGHPFNNEGRVVLPMGSGQVSGIIATLSTSFKLGSMTAARGRLVADEAVGVAGRLGAQAPTIPIELSVVQPGISGPNRQHTYHFQCAVHHRFTPLIVGAAFSAAVGGVSDLPRFNTVDFDVQLEFANGKSLRVSDRFVNTNPGDLFQGIGVAITAAAENPFGSVSLRKMTGTIQVLPEAHDGQILEINVPRSKFKAGDTLDAFVTYTPFRAAEQTLPLHLELPRDLAPGVYQLVISDAERYMQDEAGTQPFKYTAQSVGEVFDVLKSLAAIRRNALYIRLIRQPDGVAIGHTALPQLPGSRRMILLSAGRSDTTQFVSSTVKIVPTDRVITGSAEFALTIESSTRSESGSSRGPTTRSAGKHDDPKPPGKALDRPSTPGSEKP